ncbi:unnamed protein product [Toxocara canis]|uniref:Choline transporter-like protein n=1 Tax=Toxocara canis TaxID=6265 RepID=A0A183UGI0_TOXCA|nr:unnamed protein product [Toxocara canis]
MNNCICSSKPYLFYFDITKCITYSVVFAGCQTPQICVASCPTKTFTYLQMQSVPAGAQFETDVRSNIICKSTVTVGEIKDFATLRSYVDRGMCAPYTVPSAAVLGRCVPQVLLNLGQVVEQAQSANSSLNRIVSTGGGMVPTDQQIANTFKVLSASVLEKIASDISVTWWQILAMLLVTAFVALLWIVAMRILGRYLVWATILFVVAILSAGAGYCWYRYKILYDAGAITDYSFQPDISVYFEMPTTWMIIGTAFLNNFSFFPLFFYVQVSIVLSVLLLVVLVILLFVRSRIKLAVALIEESSKAIGTIMSSLLFPFFPFAFHLLVFVLWALITIWLSTSGTENCLMPRTPGGNLSDAVHCDCSTLGTGAQPGCQYINMTRDDRRIFAMQAFNLFGFFWMTCFVSALADMTLAGAFASYYWAFNKPKDVPSLPITRSFGRAIRYHLGTIAFGSLLLALVKFVRALLVYVERKLSAAQNSVAKFILLCLKCCFWCLETFLKFLTRNAYIMVSYQKFQFTAIYGKNFCTAAKDSFMLIMENIVRYTVLDKVTDFLLFLGKATITLGMGKTRASMSFSGVVAFYWFSGRWVIDGLPHIVLYYYFVPIIIVVIGAYFIADSFFDVYEMAVDTTFLCFLTTNVLELLAVEDSKQNNGTPDKPYYMSAELQRILGKQNQFNTQSK